MPVPKPGRSLRLSAIAGATLLFFACSDPARMTQPMTSAPQDATAFDGEDGSSSGILGNRAGWHPTVQQAEAQRSAAGVFAGLPMLYHGGQIMKSPKVIAIYWSGTAIYATGPAPGTTGVGTADRSLVGVFMRSLGGTNYWNINHEYYDFAGGTQNFVANSLTYVSYWANNVNVPAPGATVSDAAIRTMISSGFWTKYSPSGSTVYAVFSGPSVNLGGNFGPPSGYCGYHNFYTYSYAGVNYKIKYAVLPYTADFPSICTDGPITSPTPNSDFAADAEVSVLAHELDEAVTDQRLNAWFDANGQENADKCAWTFGTRFTTPNGATANVIFSGKNYLIQRNWKLGSNLSSQVGCRLK